MLNLEKVLRLMATANAPRFELEYWEGKKWVKAPGYNPDTTEDVSIEGSEVNLRDTVSIIGQTFENPLFKVHFRKSPSNRGGKHIGPYEFYEDQPPEIIENMPPSTHTTKPLPRPKEKTAAQIMKENIETFQLMQMQMQMMGGGLSGGQNQQAEGVSKQTLDELDRIQRVREDVDKRLDDARKLEAKNETRALLLDERKESIQRELDREKDFLKKQNELDKQKLEIALKEVDKEWEKINAVWEEIQNLEDEFSDNKESARQGFTDAIKGIGRMMANGGDEEEEEDFESLDEEENGLAGNPKLEDIGEMVMNLSEDELDKLHKTLPGYINLLNKQKQENSTEPKTDVA